MKEKQGMKSPKMPQEHHEYDIGYVETCNLKYGSEMGNPQDLKKSADSLASYVKKNKMDY